MTYIVYADVMVGYNIIINFAMLILASLIIGADLHIVRIIIYSILTGILTEILYIIMLGHNRFIYLILYSALYFIMTISFFSGRCLKKNVCQVLSVIMASILLYGVYCILPVRQSNMTVPGIFLSLIISCILILSLRRLHKIKNVYLELTLLLKDASVKCMGYKDTGNVLTDYRQTPVIIVDYMIMNRLVDEQAYKVILEYHTKGEFDYKKFASLSSICMYPLPYRTIADNFAVLPAFRLSGIILQDGTCINNVTAGISRYHFMHGRYQVLLNNKLFKRGEFK